ncbi:MAG: hypothetical protein PHN90_10000 [Methanothrix sp.]|nr:hypothetical protein [Methanothrix sp.]
MEERPILYNCQLRGPTIAMLCDVGPLIFPHPEDGRVDELLDILKEIFEGTITEAQYVHEMQPRIDAAISKLDGPREILLLGAMIFAAHVQSLLVPAEAVLEVMRAVGSEMKASEFSPEVV